MVGRALAKEGPLENVGNEGHLCQKFPVGKKLVKGGNCTLLSKGLKLTRRLALSQYNPLLVEEDHSWKGKEIGPHKVEGTWRLENGEKKIFSLGTLK